MRADLLEVLDTNIVVVPAAQFPPVTNIRTVFESEQFRELIQGPLSYNQGMIVDATTGAASLALQVESMRSRKVVALGAVRIEVHDRSGESSIEGMQLPEIAATILATFGIERQHIRALGANFEVTYRLAEDAGTAAHAIAATVLQSNLGILPDSVSVTGAGTRLFLSDNLSRAYTLAIEPRFNDRTSRDVFLSCNAEMVPSEDGSLENEITTLFYTGYSVLQEVAGRLFPDA